MNGLRGKRILVTRPQQQAASLLEQIERKGGIPLAFPVIRIEPLEDYAVLDEAIAGLDSYGWIIFTSVNGVRVFWQRLAALHKQLVLRAGQQVAAIGPVTARALEEHGVKPDYVPGEYIAEAIAAGLGEIKGQHILLPRAEIAREALILELSQRGARVDEVAVYQTVLNLPQAAMLEELKRGVDVVTFTSSSTVRCFQQILLEQHIQLPEGTAVACIGPITAQTASENGFRVDVVAESFTSDGLVSAIEGFFSTKLAVT